MLLLIYSSSGVMLVCIVVAVVNGGAVETSGHVSAVSSVHGIITINYNA